MSNCAPIAPQFATTSPTTIELKESKKFHDANGNVMFNIDAKTMTMSGRIIIKDAKGAEIGHVRKKKTPGTHATYYFGTKKNDKTGAVKAKEKLTRPDECDTDIYLGDTVIGETSGNWFKKSFKISVGGNQVAEVLRKAETVEGGFCIEIAAAGVDAAFILMIVMSLGEMYQWADSNNGGVSSCILSKSNLSNSSNSNVSDPLDDIFSVL